MKSGSVTNKDKKNPKEKAQLAGEANQNGNNNLF